MSKKVIIGTLMALAVLTVIVSITSISFIVDAIKSNELSPSPVATSTSAVTTNTLSIWQDPRLQTLYRKWKHRQQDEETKYTS